MNAHQKIIIAVDVRVNTVCCVLTQTVRTVRHRPVLSFRLYLECWYDKRTFSAVSSPILSLFSVSFVLPHIALTLMTTRSFNTE